MYRLLIVDNERYFVESMYELIRSQPDLDLDILTSCYADEALDILNSQRIDLILLDINMSGKTGLEIAAEVVKNWSTCRILFLTEYADFNYIYRSSKLKNTSFLLKTEDNTTILKAVRDAITSLDNENAQNQLISREHSKDIYLNYLLYREPLRKLLLGQHISVFEKTLSFLPGSFAFDLKHPFLLLLLKLADEHAAIQYAEDPQFIISATQQLSSCLGECFITALCPMDSSSWAIFLQPQSTLKKSTQALLLYIRETMNAGSFIPVFDRLRPILVLYNSLIEWGHAGSFFAQLSACLYDFLPKQSAQSGQIFHITPEMIKNTNAFVSEHHATIPDLASHLRFGLSANDPVRIKETLADANAFWKEHGSMHKLAAVHLYHELSNVFIEYILQHNQEKALAFHTGLFRLYHLEQFDTWQQVSDYFNTIADAILSLSANQEQSSRHQTLQRIKDYIQANLNHNLTLNEIAACVCYNSSHVSRFFHQMTGQTLSQYILQQRMEEACRCLSSGNDSIQAISEKLGFDSAQYFSNVFKKYMGVSPRDYRHGARA